MQVEEVDIEFDTLVYLDEGIDLDSIFTLEEISPNDKPPNPVPVPKFDSPVKTQKVPKPVSPQTPRTPKGRGTPKGHKSPFSISASSSFMVNMSSPHSSTPVSCDVSFSRSFDTPSFHSPIAHSTSNVTTTVAQSLRTPHFLRDITSGLSGLDSSSKSPLCRESLESFRLPGLDDTVDVLESDTLLSWRDDMETPTQKRKILETEEGGAGLVDSSDTTSLRKKMRSSETGNVGYAEVDCDDTPAKKGAVIGTIPRAGSARERVSQVSNKKLFLSPEAEKMEVDKGLPISPTPSSTSNPILENLITPIKQHDKNVVSGECSPIRESQDQDDSNQPSGTGTVDVCIQNPSEEENTDKVITATHIERDPVEANETINLFDDKDLASPAKDVQPARKYLESSTRDVNPVRKDFKYPQATQAKNQVKRTTSNDDFEFSQWPTELYDRVDKLAGQVVISNIPNEIKTEVEKEAPAKVLKVTENAESLGFSQWNEDVLESVDSAVASMKEKEKENVDCSNEITPKVGRSLQKSKMDVLAEFMRPVPQFTKNMESKGLFEKEDYSDLQISKSSANFKMASVSGHKKSNIFGEDFSDLEMNTKPSFKSAGSFTTADGKKLSSSSGKKPMVVAKKDPLSIFGEDLSDLDLSSFKSAGSGFQFASASVPSVKNVSKDLGGFRTPKMSKLEVGVFEAVSNIKVKASDDATDTEKSGEISKTVPKDTSLSSFSTASGKDVTVSKESLQYIRSSQAPANKITEAVIDSFTSAGVSVRDKPPVPFKTNTQQSKSASFGTGFTTAIGKGVSVKKESIEFIRSSQAHVQIQSSQLNMDHGSSTKAPPCKAGFATASGKHVDISKESLNFIRSSQVPVDDSRTDPGKTSISGFATAGGKTVAVKKESLNFIRSSQACPVSSSQRALPSVNQPKRSNIKPIHKETSVRPKKLRITDECKTPDGSRINKKRVSSESDREVISRVKTVSSEGGQILDSVSKRRRVLRKGSFNSPVTDRTRSCALVSSPISHRIRPGLSPLISSPKLQSTLEEVAAEVSTFVTPYNSKEPKQPTSKRDKTPGNSSMWGTSEDYGSSKFVRRSAGSEIQDIKELPPPRNHTPEQLFELGVSADVEEITAENAAKYRFSRPNHFTDSGQGDKVLLAGSSAVLKLEAGVSAGHQEFHNALLSVKNLKKTNITPEWTENHYRLIVWKCAGLERSQPREHAGRMFAPDKVMQQLLHRYATEVEEGRRSCLRKICEKDDTAAKPMTLLVSGVGPKTIELSDGWYCLEAVLDPPLSVLIQRKVIEVGTKILLFACSIAGSHGEGMPPLQARNTLKLRLNYNCVRPAIWHAKLGFTEVRTMPSLPLSVLSPEGGVCACVCVVVIRQYPLRYMETLPGGKRVCMSEREERRRQREYEQARERAVEQIAAQLNASAAKGASERGRISRTALAKIESGRELYELLSNHLDPSSLEGMLSACQLQLLREYGEKSRNREEGQHNEQMMEKLKELCPARKVTSVLKHKVVCGNRPPQGLHHPHFTLTFWRITEPLKEGRCYRIYNVQCSPLFKSRLKPSFSSTRSTVFRELPGQFPHLAVKPAYTVSQLQGTGECDVIGRVLQTDRPSDKHTLVTLADLSSLKQLALYCSEIDCSDAKTGSILAFVNVVITKAGKLIGNDKTIITSTPKNLLLAEKLKDLKSRIDKKSATFWTDMLEGRGGSPDTSTVIDPGAGDLFDEIPDLPPLDLPPDLFEAPGSANRSSVQTPRSGRFSETPDGSGGSSAQRGRDSVPLFSREDDWVSEGVPLECSEKAKGDFVTPIKPRDYESIFQ